MIYFLENTDHWENTETELATRGVTLPWSDSRKQYNGVNTKAELQCKLVACVHQVKHLNFYDIVLDFILMDSFEDLENPPVSIRNVLSNRWLNSSFKETVRQSVG